MVTAAGCYAIQDFTGHRVVALILLMAVTINAMLFEMWPVLLSAVLSAVTWNFFFIPPRFTFHIGNSEDALMFLLYFFIAFVNAVLTINIRRAEKKAREKEDKEHAIRLYNTLLNSLSHELRTPISAIMGAVDTLQENRQHLSAVQEEQLLKEIENAGLRLNRQVENLLNMSRLESGMLRPKPDWCDAEEIITGIIQKLETPGHRLIFRARGELPLFKLDSGLLEQALHNLLHNAVQHTPAGSTVTVETAHQNGCCIITVSDNGGGFPDSEIHRVFEKFYRVPGARAGGSGLGLSIVKGFTEAMLGTISLQNLPQGGARFVISLPAATSFMNRLNHE